MMKIAGSGSEPGSINQRHGSADPDPDPHQIVMDPQHWNLSRGITFGDFVTIRRTEASIYIFIMGTYRSIFLEFFLKNPNT
jgi:hypothetical protein